MVNSLKVHVGTMIRSGHGMSCPTLNEEFKHHRPLSIFMQVRGQRVQNEDECTQAKLLIACTYKVQRTFGTVRCNDTLFNTEEPAQIEEIGIVRVNLVRFNKQVE